MIGEEEIYYQIIFYVMLEIVNALYYDGDERNIRVLMFIRNLIVLQIVIHVITKM